MGGEKFLKTDHFGPALRGQPDQPQGLFQVLLLVGDTVHLDSGNLQHQEQTPCFLKSLAPFSPRVKDEKGLAHLHFCDSFFFSKASLWPGRKGVARKKHRREKNSIGRSPRASAE
jgi:hypothetical protein